MQGADRLPTDPFRPDLEGLRGVAILLVLAFHAGLPFVAGGFVGVDVFFVLSGFLITGLLVREREQTGRIDLRTFYERRARRILPAAAVVLVATLALSWLVLSPLDLIRVSDDAIAAALSAGNIRFALEATDYFSAGVTPSPFLHYWSLGVEEQFYLLWPALLIVATWLPRPRLAAGLVLALVLIGSYALALYLTDASQAWAFYSLPTRAWQLALGGLLAVLVARRRTSEAPLDEGAAPEPARWRIPDPVIAALGWAGLGAILASVVLIDPRTPYPGLAALAPSLGAAALIGAGDRRFSPAGLLVLAPLRFLGRISYSLYLVHWPLLILPAAGLAIGEELPIGVRLGLAALAIVLGFLSYRLVELPFHRGLRFAMRPGRTLALAGATIAATAVIALGVGTVMSRDLDSSLSAAETGTSVAEVASPSPADDADPAPADTPSPNPSGDAGDGSSASVTEGAGTAAGSARPTNGNGPAGSAAPEASPGPGATGAVAAATSGVSGSSADPSGSAGLGGSTASPAASGPAVASASLVPAATAQSTPAPAPPPAAAAPLRHPTGRQPLPAGVRPSLLRAADDEEKLVTNGCNAQHPQVQPPDCSFGNPNGTFTVALIGDSHTSQWFPALERIADQRGWRLVTFTKYDCRFMDIRIYSQFLKREYTECTAWREVVIQRLEALQPQLVIVGVSRFPQVIDPADADPVRQGRSLARVLARVPGQHAILVDTPRSNFDVPPCISSHRVDVTPCETPRSAAFFSRHRIVERTAAQINHATLIDLSDQICPWERCPVLLNGMIVYRDNHHLTATFAASLADAFAAVLPSVAQQVGAVRRSFSTAGRV